MMKIITLLLFGVINSYAQNQEITFNSRFLPEKEYLISSFSETNNILSLQGSDEIIKSFKDEGFDFPIESQNKMFVLVEMKNGKLQLDDDFPYIMEYKSLNSTTIINGETTEEESPLTGLVIEGIYNSTGQMKILHINSDNVSEATKETFKTTLESLTQSIPFPTQPMKIGDSFNQVIPMSFPVSDLTNVNIVISTIYLLDEIKDDSAYFNIIQSMELNMDQNETTILLDGNGVGTAVYNIIYNFISDVETNSKMKISIEVEDLIFINELEAKTIQKIEIK